jgi:hypothetical protein
VTFDAYIGYLIKNVDNKLSVLDMFLE